MTSRSAQTLIEVMIALFVLTAGILGILSLLAQSLSISKITTDNTIGTYLAEEGIELARNIVDHDIYQQRAGIGATGWPKGGADTAFPTSGDYHLDYTTCTNILGGQISLPCNPFQGNGGALNFDSSHDLYRYGGNGSPSPFTRTIQVVVQSDPNILKVDSIVTWSTGTFTSGQVRLEDYFYNWQP